MTNATLLYSSKRLYEKYKNTLTLIWGDLLGTYLVNLGPFYLSLGHIKFDLKSVNCLVL